MMNRRRMLPAFVVPMLYGSISLFNTLSRPTLQAVRAVDIVQLLVSGMCFGVALMSLVLFVRGRKVS